MGDGTTGSSGAPVEVSGNDSAFLTAGWYHICAVSGVPGFVFLAAGSAHTCGLTGDGAASCWGCNAAGRLGDGMTTNRLTSVAVASLGGLRADRSPDR